MTPAQLIYHILGSLTLTAKYTVPFQHFPDNTQLYRVVIDYEDLCGRLSLPSIGAALPFTGSSVMERGIRIRKNCLPQDGWKQKSYL